LGPFCIPSLISCPHSVLGSVLVDCSVICTCRLLTRTTTERGANKCEICEICKIWICEKFCDLLLLRETRILLSCTYFLP
jgi:hypothetical protein